MPVDLNTLKILFEVISLKVTEATVYSVYLKINCLCFSFTDIFAHTNQPRSLKTNMLTALATESLKTQKCGEQYYLSLTIQLDASLLFRFF